MKTPSLFLFVVLTTLFACKKSVTNPESPQTDRVLRIIDGITKQPIEGVKVTFIRCAYTADGGGCGGAITLYFLYTDKEGKVPVSSTENFKVITCEHEGYWPQEAQGNIELELRRISIIKARFKQINSYLNTDKLSATINDGSTAIFSISSIKLGLPTDTIVYLKGYGGRLNTLNWYINEVAKPEMTQSFSINTLDTTHLTINY